MNCHLFHPRFWINLLWIALVCGCASSQDTNGNFREGAIEFLQNVGLSKELERTVRIAREESGVLIITDPGQFFVQYMILGPETARTASITIEENITLPETCDKVVVITHGWIDKGADDWPSEMAYALLQDADPNEWACCVFDWRRGAAVVNPVDAARYGRDIAGPRLAQTIYHLLPDVRHVHLIGHSAGSWTVNSAAQELIGKTGAAIHITFLDAYVPPFWDESQLGNMNRAVFCEHYYTRDITMRVTGTDLTNAHNVDITRIDPWFKEHVFPYRWYHATITGHYGQRKMERRFEVITCAGGIEYGFCRSRERGPDTWQESLALPRGNKAVVLRK
ncbi:MAG: alpha/beta hydrolase [Sedimentisphaerales bacterium]|nr:alpha/beta hydrolase [Sedimentisphaerales bacterium]